MSLLFLRHPLPVSDLESWVRSEHRAERDKALSVLERLKILKRVSNPGKPAAYSLTSPFLGSLRNAMTGGGSHESFGVPCDTPQTVSIAKLDEFARRQWEGLLSYMVGSASANMLQEAPSIAENVKSLLQEGGLVTGGGRRSTITQEGFTFVLEEVNTQVWQILVTYLELAPKVRCSCTVSSSLTPFQTNMDQGIMLSFLFQLGSLELGQDYSAGSLSPTQIQMLEDLSDLGLIYQSSPTSTRFYPTRLATTLTSDASALRNSSVGLNAASRQRATDGSGAGFVIIETNYRLYAYTTSSLQIAILSLFTRLTGRYPNLVAGKITRQSVRDAVAMGITADQIVSFLNTHAHTQMRRNNPVLPASVVDQIRLWQIEGERMKATNGYLFKDFASQTEYEDVCRYARDLGVLAWRSDAKRKCFITEVQQMKTYIKSRQKKQEKS